MTQLELQPDSTESPFDAIRHIDADGIEHWFGRELMSLMDYSRWERFSTVINKAKASLALVQGEQAAKHHFPISGSDGGRWGGKLEDFRLTRFGAYLTAMAGDDTKEAVAQARIYFAVKAREAEAAKAVAVVERDANHPAIPQSFADALRLAADQQEQIEAQQAALEAAAPKVEYVDQFLRDDDACTIRVFAKQIGIKESALREYLIGRRIIFKQAAGQRFSKSKQRWVDEYSYQPYATHTQWFRIGDQPNAPRLNNGQLRTTLYVTPAGKVGIARLLDRVPVSQPAIEGATA